MGAKLRFATHRQIELFFKALKQNLKIKTFVGISANVLKTQIWTALISMLLLRYLQLPSRFGWGLSNIVAPAHESLHPPQSDGLDKPFTTPPALQDSPQGHSGLRLILGSTRRHDPENPSCHVRKPHQFKVPSARFQI